MLLSLALLTLSAADPASNLDWMAGCHALETPRGLRIEEQWMKPEGGLMLGVNRTVRGGKAVAFEFLRIHADGETLVYTAMPNGRNETAFRSTSASATEVVFENPAHDFPKRITYRKVEGGILAQVDDGANPPVKKQAFAMKTSPCSR